MSDPALCNIDDTKNTGDVEVLGLREPEVIASAIMTAADKGPMATMLLKARKFIY